MTNKQIIIDGINVSECPYYIDGEGGCSSHDCECIKCVHNACFYKDLKAKERECEELKDEIKHYKQIAQYHGNLSVKYTNKSTKFKQCLARIKEIAEENIRIADLEGLNGVYRRGLAEQILQKISEVENNE